MLPDACTYWRNKTFLKKTLHQFQGCLSNHLCCIFLRIKNFEIFWVLWPKSRNWNFLFGSLWLPELVYSSFLVSILYEYLSCDSSFTEMQHVCTREWRMSCISPSDNVNISSPVLAIHELILSLLLMNMLSGVNCESKWRPTIRPSNPLNNLPVTWKTCCGINLLAELPCCIAAGPDSSANIRNV